MATEVTAYCDNVIVSRMAEILHAADKAPGQGDSIDTGLILLRMLNEKGFRIFYEKKDFFSGSHEQIALPDNSMRPYKGHNS